MDKEDFASLLLGARMMSLAEFRSLMERLGYGLFEPAPFDFEQMEQAADKILEEERQRREKRDLEAFG
jgi:hypothetical protein